MTIRYYIATGLLILFGCTASVGCADRGKPSTSDSGSTAPLVPFTGNTNAPMAPTPSWMSGGSNLPERWWQWAAATPEDPRMDTTGELCDANQPSDVWFLASNKPGDPTTSRSCQIPADRPVFVPVVAALCPILSGSDPEAAAAECTPTASDIRARLDGAAVAVTARRTGAFSVTGTEGSPIAGPTPSTVVASGQWAGPITVSSGTHTLELAAATPHGPVRTTWSLTVDP